MNSATHVLFYWNEHFDVHFDMHDATTHSNEYLLVLSFAQQTWFDHRLSSRHVMQNGLYSVVRRFDFHTHPKVILFSFRLLLIAFRRFDVSAHICEASKRHTVIPYLIRFSFRLFILFSLFCWYRQKTSMKWNKNDDLLQCASIDTFVRRSSMFMNNFCDFNAVFKSESIGYCVWSCFDLFLLIVMNKFTVKFEWLRKMSCCFAKSQVQSLKL